MVLSKYSGMVVCNWGNTVLCNYDNMVLCNCDNKEVFNWGNIVLYLYKVISNKGILLVRYGDNRLCGTFFKTINGLL